MENKTVTCIILPRYSKLILMSRKLEDAIEVSKELSFSKLFTEYFGHYQNNNDELVLLRFQIERLCNSVDNYFFKVKAAMLNETLCQICTDDFHARSDTANYNNVLLKL